MILVLAFVVVGCLVILGGLFVAIRGLNSWQDHADAAHTYRDEHADRLWCKGDACPWRHEDNQGQAISDLPVVNYWSAGSAE